VARAVYVDERGERREVSIREEALHAGPVLETRVLATAGGPVGYLLLDRFDLEGANAVRAAFSQFREAGVTELVVDLRYNPGGAIRASATLASLIAGPVHAGKPYVALRHNARHSDRDTRRFLLTGETKALGLSRVFVITSAHTCSASELLINGLRPHLEVVTVGSTTCGKPYGFSGVLHRDTVYTVVSFEAVNAAGEGGYTDGLAAHCPALDDLGHALGAPEEDSLRTALAYIATGACAREPLAQSPAGTALP
jgi:hypothetical protein